MLAARSWRGATVSTALAVPLRHPHGGTAEGSTGMLNERDETWAEVCVRGAPRRVVVLRPLWRESQGIWAVCARPMTEGGEAKPRAEAFG